MPPCPQPDTPDLPPDTAPSRQRLRGQSLLAVAVGALLAVACWGMATHGDRRVAEAGYAGVFAFAMVSAGAASFVLHALHAHGQGRRLSATTTAQVARRLILLLGVSFSGAMHLLNTCLPG